MAKDLVNELYKFINSDKSVSFQSLKDATDSAYAGVGRDNDAMLKEHEELMGSSELFTKMPADWLEVTAENVMLEWSNLRKDKAFLQEHINETAPEGWEGTVKAMKSAKGISNPWALSWYMKGKGYKSNKAQEGRLTANLANIQDPDKEIKTLAEGEKEGAKSAVKSANVGMTPTPEKGPLQMAMDKATPDVDKKSDFQVAAKVSTAKKVEPEITGVSKGDDKELKDEKNKPMKEGTLVKDPSTVSYGQIQTLAEEKALVTVSDENVAKGIAAKYSGGRVVPDAEKKQFVVMVTDESVIKEDSALPTDVAKKVGDDVPYVDDKNSSTLTPISATDPKEGAIKDAESNVEKSPKDPDNGAQGASTGKQEAPAAEPSATGGKADQNASKKRDDETQQVLQHSSDPKGQTTTDPGKPEVKDTNSVAGTKAVKADKLTPEAKVTESEVVVTPDGTVTVSTEGGMATMPPAPMEATPAMTEEEPEMSEEETTEFAERVFLSDYLSSLGEAKLTEKQKAFIAETKGKKMSKKNKEKVEMKLKAMKSKKK